MTDHVAALGFGSLDLDDFEALIYMAVEQGSPLLSPNGSYVAWSPGDHIELWALADLTPQLVGAHPHFRGSTSLTLSSVTSSPNPEHPLEGLAHGVLDSHALSLDVLTFDAWHHRHIQELPCDFQVCAFAHDLEVLSDEDAALSFQPLHDHPEGPSVAELVARLETSSLLRNPITHERFYHLTISISPDTQIDAVLPSKMLRKRPRPGLMLAGEFWLSAAPLGGDAS